MNLLSPQQKGEIQTDIFKRFLFVFSGIFLLWAATFVALAYNTALYLELQIPSIEERLQAEQETQRANIVQEVEGDIRELNDTLLTIEEIREKGSFNFPYILRVLGRMVPEGTTLRSITFQGKNMIIQGHADERQGVLTLKENLEKESIFTNVLSPLSNIVKERDIDFSFNFSINGQRIQ